MFFPAKLQKNKKHLVALSLSTTSSVPRKPAAQQWLPRPHHLAIPSAYMGFSWKSTMIVCLHVFYMCFTCVLYVFYMCFICVLVVLSISDSPNQPKPKVYCAQIFLQQWLAMPTTKQMSYWQMQRFPPCLRAWVWKNLPSGKGVDVHFELKRWLRGTFQITVNFRRELAKSPACGSNKSKKTSIHILLILRVSV